MKIINRPFTYMLGLASIFSLSSCDLYNRIFSKNDQSVKKEAVLPQDREVIETKKDTKVYSPDELKKGNILGDWTVVEAEGKKVVGENPPYFSFDEKKMTVIGYDGCNFINGSFKFNPQNHSFTFGDNLSVTLRGCPSNLTDREILSAVRDTRKYSLTESEDGSYVLTLQDSKGNPVMTLTHQNLDFLNGSWRVIKIDGVEPIDGKEPNFEKMKLVFDIPEKKFHGNTGCNVLNGRIETNISAPNTFSFEGIAVTMMMCPEIEYQRAMLVALEEAARAKRVDEKRMILLDLEGDPLMTLEKYEEDKEI